MDAVHPVVDHGNAAAGADGDGLQGGQILAVAARPKLELERAVCAEHVDAALAGIGRDDAAVGGDGDCGYAQHAPMAGATRPEGGLERAVGAEHVDADVAWVGHDDAAVGGDGDGGRATAGREFQVAQAQRERAVGVEDLDGGAASAVTANAVDHDDAAVGADGDCGRAFKLPVAKTVRPKRERKCAVGMEHLNAAVAGVGDGNHARIDLHGIRVVVRCSGQRGQHCAGH